MDELELAVNALVNCTHENWDGDERIVHCDDCGAMNDQNMRGWSRVPLVEAIAKVWNARKKG